MSEGDDGTVCPGCLSPVDSQDWNCPACRVNLYWASQHHEELVRLRRGQGFAPHPPTAGFLIRTHREEMARRAAAGGVGGQTDEHSPASRNETRVRVIARSVMRAAAGATENSPEHNGPDVPARPA